MAQWGCLRASTAPGWPGRSSLSASRLSSRTRPISSPPIFKASAGDAGRRRRPVGLRQCLGGRPPGARGPRGLRLRLAGPQTRRGDRHRPSVRRLFRLALSADLFFVASACRCSLRGPYVFWVFATFPAYLVAIRAIIGDRIGYLLAAAFPAVLSEFRCRPERISDRGTDRRHAGAVDRQPSWPASCSGC